MENENWKMWYGLELASFPGHEARTGIQLHLQEGLCDSREVRMGVNEGDDPRAQQTEVAG